MAQNSLRDNFSNGSVGDFLKSLIDNQSNLSFVTAYFTIYAYDRLKQQLDGVNNLRLLFGEPRFIKSVSSSTEAKNYQIEDNNLVIPVENRLQQKLLARQCSEWIRSKVEIKSMVRPDFLHGKLYHVEKANGVQEAITGSSNFTVNGLGLGSRPNIELNIVVNDRRDLADLKIWFDKLWNNEMDGVEVEDVKEQVLKYIELLHRENSPEFVYYKTLFHVFEQYLQDADASGLSDIKANLYDTQIWKELFAFQQHGATGAINKILRYNGCIIADSVGLGKTYEALAVIKYFELQNYRVLVLCPKKLRDNWTVYQAHKNNLLNPFGNDRFSYTVMYHTDLSRDKGHTEADNIDLSNFNWGAYDLVVIDESHNFRNNKKGKRDEEGNIIRISRYERLMNDIITQGKKTQVLLLSATPVNNELKDLRNQLMFIAGDNDTAFQGEESIGIDSVAELLKQSQLRFTNWAKGRIKEEKTTGDLLNELDSAFFKLLDALTIARSRKHIRKYYAKEMDRIGGFPKHAPVHSIYPDIDSQHKFLTYDKLNEKISKYALAHFGPSSYVLPEYKTIYEEIVLKRSGPIYGENGSGKSSLFKALNSYLSSSRNTALPYVKNLNAEAKDGRVGLSFQDFDDASFAAVAGTESTLYYGSAGFDHNVVFVQNADLIKGFLDYKSLLEVYLHREPNPNLFNLIVLNLLGGHFPVAGTYRFFEKWEQLQYDLIEGSYTRNDNLHQDGLADLPIYEGALRDTLSRVFEKLNLMLSSYFPSSECFTGRCGATRWPGRLEG